MITEISESEYGLNIEIKPETVEEVAMLLRYAKNAKAEKPDVSFSFYTKPYLSLWCKKVKKSVQENSIRPGK